jgi:DNA-binding CsgD family transcriptional regulator
VHSSHTEPNYRSGSSVTQHLTRNSAQLPGIKGKHLQTVGSKKSPQDSASRARPLFTVEESILMRGVSAGKSDKQLCIELRLPLPSFHRLLRDLMAKTGTSDKLGLLVWALRQKQGADSREKERDYQWRRPGTDHKI